MFTYTHAQSIYGFHAIQSEILGGLDIWNMTPHRPLQMQSHQ